MRKSKTFTIEGNAKAFEIRELRVKEVLELLSQDFDQTDLATFREKVVDKLLIKSGNITTEDLLNMTPSELEEVWNHFNEVNSSFFALARKTGLLQAMQQIGKSFIEDLSRLFATSLSTDM